MLQLLCDQQLSKAFWNAWPRQIPSELQPQESSSSPEFPNLQTCTSTCKLLEMNTILQDLETNLVTRGFTTWIPLETQPILADFQNELTVEDECFLWGIRVIVP